jgi:Bacteriophage lambda head decoration protein D
VAFPRWLGTRQNHSELTSYWSTNKNAHKRFYDVSLTNQRRPTVRYDNGATNKHMNWEPFSTLATILAGQGVLPVNTALGIVTASGKLKVLNSLSTDGSQTLAAVLNKTIDTTSGDVVAPIVIGQSGYPKGSLKYGGTDTDVTHFNALGQARANVDFYIY